MTPESAEIKQCLSRDYHICHKVSGSLLVLLLLIVVGGESLTFSSLSS